MYRIEEEQLRNLVFIVNNLTVTGPTQGGYLNLAGSILETVKQQKVEPPKRKGDDAS